MSKYVRKPVIQKACSVCGESFETTQKRKTFCSKRCSAAPSYRVYDLPPSTIGTLSELIAAVHLLKEGFDMFRALSACAHCDLMGFRQGDIYRFEVRTGYINPRGALAYPRKNIRAENLCVVILKENRLVMIPAEPVPYSAAASQPALTMGTS